MRGLRSTIALLVVLIGLGAYIYFVEPKSETGPDREKVFASLAAEDIQELKIKSESGDVTAVKKEAGAWKIVEPIAAPAAESEVSGITTAVAQMQVVRVIDEKPANLGDYGLASPRITVDFKSAAGKPSGRLLVGDKTPTGGSLYAKREDQPRVFLIEAYEESSLNRSTFDLRDKTLVRFERDKVDAVEVSLATGTIEFGKENGEWKMTKPIAARVDAGAVEGLVSRVQTAQMKSVVSEDASPGDVKKAGFDSPTASVTVRMGSARATLLLGGTAEENAVYARDASKPLIATVETSLADDLKKQADDYRRKEAFEFRPFNATHVEFTRDGQTVGFDRVKGEGENAQDSWRRVSPNPANVDRAKMDDLLIGLTDIRATGFTSSMANTGLDSPAMTVLVKFDEGKKEERVLFGRRGDEVYFSRPGEAGAARLDAAAFSKTIKALDELSK